jgi:hypothetical protein
MKLYAPVIAGLLLGACTTTANDVDKTDAVGEQKTLEAYDHADEVALKAQNEADAKADAAYDQAEKVEIKAAKESSEVRRKIFVQEMSAQLAHRRQTLQDLEAASEDQGNPDLKAIQDAEHGAEVALNDVKQADWSAWEQQAPRVEHALALFDRRMNEAQRLAH